MHKGNYFHPFFLPVNGNTKRKRNFFSTARKLKQALQFLPKLELGSDMQMISGKEQADWWLLSAYDDVRLSSEWL